MTHARYHRACSPGSKFELPMLDEPAPASSGQYSRAHTRAWSATIASFDGYVFVTPEYNHGPSAALKNAIDFLHKEWANKAAGVIGYGASLGARAVEQLRLTMAALQVATVTASRAVDVHGLREVLGVQAGRDARAVRQSRVRSHHRVGWCTPRTA
jgi:NAD(P)H-dependent FMN reductase